MPTNKYAPVAWGGEVLADLTCPSGQVCQVRKLGMEDLIELDIMDDVDFLGAAINEEHIQRVGGKRPQDRKPKKLTKAQEAAKEAEDLRNLMADKPRFRKIVRIMDKLVTYAVLQPPIESCWEEGRDDNGDMTYNKFPMEDRKTGVVYSDTVGIEDKMFIFDYCFSGVMKMDSFREESEKAVGDVEPEPGFADPTE